MELRWDGEKVISATDESCVFKSSRTLVGSVSTFVQYGMIFQVGEGSSKSQDAHTGIPTNGLVGGGALNGAGKMMVCYCPT